MTGGEPSAAAVPFSSWLSISRILRSLLKVMCLASDIRSLMRLRQAAIQSVSCATSSLSWFRIKEVAALRMAGDAGSGSVSVMGVMAGPRQGVLASDGVKAQR
uniref:Uncharacterized protein n=1 Tax=Curvibacter symbiont subsp. Hydra magnipapillata TaxID=667019 RepID=C9Y733_CURXX|nr:hypothetical protein Csp_G38210 [Curvibacter putative symbiont of Hydra magnipapillata]